MLRFQPKAKKLGEVRLLCHNKSKDKLKNVHKLRNSAFDCFNPVLYQSMIIAVSHLSHKDFSNPTRNVASLVSLESVTHSSSR